MSRKCPRHDIRRSWRKPRLHREPWTPASRRACPPRNRGRRQPSKRSSTRPGVAREFRETSGLDAPSKWQDATDTQFPHAARPRGKRPMNAAGSGGVGACDSDPARSRAAGYASAFCPAAERRSRLPALTERQAAPMPAAGSAHEPPAPPATCLPCDQTNGW